MKAASTSWLSDATFGVDLGRVGLHTDPCSMAIDFSLERNEAIVAALVCRHRKDGPRLFSDDLSPSFVEGSHHELAAFGRSRDGKRGKRRVQYGIVATNEGLPLASRWSRAPPRLERLTEIVETTTERFGLSRIVFVGDRATTTSARVAALQDASGFGRATALRSGEITALVSDGAVHRACSARRTSARSSTPTTPVSAASPARTRARRAALTEAPSAAVGD